MCHMITRAQNAINRSHERGDEGELRATGKSLFPRLIPPQTGDTWGETGIILHNNIGTRTRHSFINTGHRVWSVAPHGENTDMACVLTLIPPGAMSRVSCVSRVTGT